MNQSEKEIIKNDVERKDKAEILNFCNEYNLDYKELIRISELVQKYR